MRAFFFVAFVLAIPAHAGAIRGGYVATPALHSGIASTRSGAGAVALDTSKQQMMLRSTHVARDALTSVKIMVPNFFVNGSFVEAGSGAAATVTASVEYPQGTCTQVKFGGSASGSVPDNGTLVSDASSVSIPNGATFWIRQYVTSTIGVLYDVGFTTITGDNMRLGASGVPDQTVSCDSIINVGTGLAVPMAIISPTTTPNLCLIGDSITYGSGDSTASATGDRGMVARSVGPTFGYTNMGLPSDRTVFYNASHANRAAAYPYCTHVIVEYGTNDLNSGSTAAAVESLLTTLYGSLGVSRVFQTTILPRPATTDTCATLGNQTLPTWEAQRLTINDALKGGSFGPSKGKFDTSGAVETATDSGFWKTSPSKWSDDCIHPNIFGAGSIASSGAINTSAITYP